MTAAATPAPIALTPEQRAARARKTVRTLRRRLAKLETTVKSLRLWVRIAIALGIGEKVLDHHAEIKTALASILGG